MRDDELNRIADELTGGLISFDQQDGASGTWDPYFQINVELMGRPDDIEGVWEPKLPSIEGSVMENAGIDVFAATEAEWERASAGIWTAIIRSGLKFELPRGLHLRAASRSGLGFRENITSFPGTIDSSYRGEFMGKLFAFSDEQPAPVGAGDKFVQLIPFLISYNVGLTVIEEVNKDTRRGAKGFGSTG